MLNNNDVPSFLGEGGFDMYKNDSLDNDILNILEDADSREYPYDGCSVCPDWETKCCGVKADECAFDADPAFNGVEEEINIRNILGDMAYAIDHRFDAGAELDLDKLARKLDVLRMAI